MLFVRLKVFVVKPENNLFLSEDPNDRPSASVYVDTGGATLDKNNVVAIQFLVSRAVKGLTNLKLQLWIIKETFFPKRGGWRGASRSSRPTDESLSGTREAT